VEGERAILDQAETARTDVPPGPGSESHSDSREESVPSGPPFSPEEIEQFHAEDRLAARMIVLLLAAVFSIGLVLYTVICLLVVFSEKSVG
jgi:hypothetical protein